MSLTGFEPGHLLSEANTLPQSQLEVEWLLRTFHKCTYIGQIYALRECESSFLIQLVAGMWHQWDIPFVDVVALLGFSKP